MSETLIQLSNEKSTELLSDQQQNPFLTSKVIRKPGFSPCRVLFLYPNERGMSTIPPSIAGLSQILKDEGHVTSLFDTTFYKFDDEDIDDDDLHFKKTTKSAVDDFRKAVLEFKPDIIAVSCTETTFLRGMKIIDETRDLGIKNLFGGVFPTFAPDLVMTYSNVDMICVGEGENAMIDLANTISNKDTPSNLTNLWIRQKDGSIQKNSISRPVSIDEIPAITDIELFGEERFYRPMGGKIRRLLPVETHRGCPFTCSFCNSPGQNRLYGDGDFKKGLSFFRKKDMNLVKRQSELETEKEKCLQKIIKAIKN